MRPFLILFFTCWIVSLYLPWWTVLAPAILIGAWLCNHPLRAFVIGFLAGGTAWFFQALYIHIANDAILSTRMAEALGVGSPWILMLITFIVGGLPAGLGTALGVQIKKVLKPTQHKQIA